MNYTNFPSCLEPNVPTIPHLAKTLSFSFRASALLAAPPSKSSKTLLSFFRDAVIAGCFP